MPGVFVLKKKRIEQRKEKRKKKRNEYHDETVLRVRLTVTYIHIFDNAVQMHSPKQQQNNNNNNNFFPIFFQII